MWINDTRNTQHIIKVLLAEAGQDHNDDFQRIHPAPKWRSGKKRNHIELLASPFYEHNYPFQRSLVLGGRRKVLAAVFNEPEGEVE